MCFQSPILLGAPCCAWGPKQGRRKILSGPCCESLAGLANSASPGCNGINQTQLASLEILCTTTFTSEAKPHGPPPPLLPTPQGTAEHRSIFHCILSQESQTLPHLTAGCYSCCPRLLLASLPPHFSLSFFVLSTGQGRGQQQSWLCQTRRSNTLALCRRQVRELALPCEPAILHLSVSPTPKILHLFSTKIRDIKTARFIRVNMSEWWHNYCHSSLFRGYLTTLHINTFRDVM